MAQLKESGQFISDNTALRLREAMREGLTVSFIYDGKPKTVEIHAIGHSTADGGLVARGFQVGGHASRPLPIWALYRIEKITTLAVDTISSMAPRAGYVRDDRQMRQPVLVQL